MRKGVRMINGIGPTGPGRIDPARSDSVQRGVATAKVVPIKGEKVAAIRAAIAEGRYPIDAKAIAEKMIELDLPAKPKS
jgi:negative regulator of flagellin synthesis FlgM